LTSRRPKKPSFQHYVSVIPDPYNVRGYAVLANSAVANKNSVPFEPYVNGQKSAVTPLPLKYRGIKNRYVSSCSVAPAAASL